MTAKVANAQVTITFDNTNTNANPTLNVNSTGAKSIVVNGVPISSSTAGLLTGTTTKIVVNNVLKY